MRRALLFLALALLAPVVATSPAGAAPAGPRLAVTQLVGFSTSSLLTFGAGGTEMETLFASEGSAFPLVAPLSAPSWSPDGTELAVTAIVGAVQGRYVSFPRTQVAIVPAAGGRPIPVDGTRGGRYPVFSPDGREIAFGKERRRWRANDRNGVETTFDSVSTWIVDLRTGNAHQLTPWRNGVEQVPSSFSPDGSLLALTRDVHGAPDAVAIPVAGGHERLLVGHALEPVFSPDGRSLAFLRGPRRTVTRRHRSGNTEETSRSRFRLTNLFVRDMTDGVVRRLTDSPQALDAAPSWDPSGQVLAYTELAPLRSEAASWGLGDAVKTINADGSCAATFLRAPPEIAIANGGWQPGAGRDAGPMSC